MRGVSPICGVEGVISQHWVVSSTVHGRGATSHIWGRGEGSMIYGEGHQQFRRGIISHLLGGRGSTNSTSAIHGRGLSDIHGGYGSSVMYGGVGQHPPMEEAAINYLLGGYQPIFE